MKYILNQKEYDEYQRLLARSNLTKEYTHPTKSISQTYEKLKEKQYKQYFEYCVRETGMQFSYPKDRDKIQDGRVMLNELNTDDNIKVLEKIRENIGIDGIIPIGVDNEGCIIYASLRSGGIWFGRSGHGINDYCLIPSIK